MSTIDLPCLLNNLPITTLTGVGPIVQQKLTRLNIKTIIDLLFHLPLRYQNKSKIYNIANADINQEILVRGHIINVYQTKTKTQKSQYTCTIKDHTGILNLIFFNLTSFQRNTLKKNSSIQAFGEIKQWGLHYSMMHPEFIAIDPNKLPLLASTLSPIYPSTQGLGQKLFQKLIQQALQLLKEYPLPELLPESSHELFKSYNLNTALAFCHFPNIDTDPSTLLSGEHLAKKRLIFEELLAHELSAKLIKQNITKQQAYCLPLTTSQKDKLIDSLPFELTTSQNQSIAEILKDLNHSYPMNRLLQGDVGSGKTIVAAFAIYAAFINNKQVALLAPTEILAQQHALSLKKLFTTLCPDIQISCFTGNIPAKEKKQQLNNLRLGKLKVIIGTHAIFQNAINYESLSLVIIDEQHRFGVHQRLTLLNKGRIKNVTPHHLIMTATPIPRTLTMSSYNHLDSSYITTLPKQRQPIHTVAIRKQDYNIIIEKINKFCASKQQVYWVCPLIYESAKLNSAAAQSTYEYLKTRLPKQRLGLLHGQLTSTEKEQVMQDFIKGHINILITTTVIEVGIDVSNANLIIIESAERMGLTQLHQLRGRVGRGSHPGFCLLLYQSPLSIVAKQRLDILRTTNNGFTIAEKDWEIRGSGAWLSTEQSGTQAFYFADLKRDYHLLTQINSVAASLLTQAPKKTEQLLARWLPHKIIYAQI